MKNDAGQINKTCGAGNRKQGVMEKEKMRMTRQFLKDLDILMETAVQTTVTVPLKMSAQCLKLAAAEQVIRKYFNGSGNIEVI